MERNSILVGSNWGEPEPHTRELGGEISVHLYVCLLVSVRLRARIAGQNVRVSMAEQLLTPSQQVTGSIPGNYMFFFLQDLLSACNLRTCASAASIFCILHALRTN